MPDQTPWYCSWQYCTEAHEFPRQGNTETQECPTIAAPSESNPFPLLGGGKLWGLVISQSR